MNAGATPAMFPHAPVPAPYGGLAVRHAAVAPPPVPGLHIRQVTAANYVSELDAIGALLARYPFIAVDTEYPGTVHGPPSGSLALALTPAQRYALVKANVDEVPVVQLGITLCDEFGNIPVVRDATDGRPRELAWEVTFSDFDARGDRPHPHALESVAFLQSQGFNFDHARARGVSSAAFAAKLAAVLSASAPRQGDGLTWAAFGGAYDFAYLVKMLAGGRPLPGTWHEFISQARDLLGGRVFDAKYMADHCDERPDLCGGGLRRLAARLHVSLPRNSADLSCLAGRKSHIAVGIFTAMRRRVMYRDGGACFQGLIDGLH